VHTAGQVLAYYEYIDLSVWYCVVLQCREAKFLGTVGSVCCCKSLCCILDTISLSKNANVA
jgi:hypothetical protein